MSDSEADKLENYLAEKAKQDQEKIRRLSRSLLMMLVC